MAQKISNLSLFNPATESLSKRGVLFIAFFSVAFYTFMTALMGFGEFGDLNFIIITSSVAVVALYWSLRGSVYFWIYVIINLIIKEYISRRYVNLFSEIDLSGRGAVFPVIPIAALEICFIWVFGIILRKIRNL